VTRRLHGIRMGSRRPAPAPHGDDGLTETCH
jgi:hypothetical protein